jgi:predicted MFS family arabinose efflux permease
MLVSVHGLETNETAGLFMINSIVSFVASPRMGRLVARFGEQRILTFNFVCLIGIFLGYATVDSTQVLIALFVVDNLFFGFALAINSYFQKIAVIPQDITPNMSLAQSINHVAAVIVPAGGGWMWATYGSASPFLAGAVLALISLPLVGLMRVPRREVVGAAAD